MKRIAIGQAGGPTPVINATLAGFVQEVKEEGFLVFIRNGYEGLANGDFITGSSKLLRWVIDHTHVPGACLGSGRYPLTDEKIEQALRHLRKHRIDALVFIGGNGTMEALHKVAIAAEQKRYDLQVIGLPKTVDNDLGCTDHAPGFGSAARYVAVATRDMSRDLLAMKNFEQLRILETMGRNTGWLAASSGLLRTYEEEGPHFVALPERSLDQEKLVTTIEGAIRKFGCATVVVSEGVRWENGEPIEQGQVDGRSVLGGVSGVIADYLRNELNITVRSELLGMNQRSFSLSVSQQDHDEAYYAGVRGGQLLKQDQSGVMVAIERNDNSSTYDVNFFPARLGDVIKVGERKMPDQFIENVDTYYKWLNPLVGQDLSSYPRPFLRRSAYV